MNKPKIYIVVKDGLVQDVYMHSVFGSYAAQADVEICDLDTTEEEELACAQKLVDELPSFANHIY